MSWNEKLIEAVKNRDLDAVRLCLGQGANVNYRPSIWNTRKHKLEYKPNALDYAVDNSEEDILKVLLNNFPDLNNTNNWRQSPLLRCIKKKAWSIAKLLIDAGADVNLNDSTLLEAIHGGHLETVKLLISKGAKVNSIPINIVFNSPIEDFNSPLIAAMAIERSDIVELLLDSGADINKAGITSPLIWATSGKHLNWIKFLLNKGANMNLVVEQGTPLTCAARYGYLDMVTFWVETGIDINKGLNSSPITEAASRGFLPIVKYLVSKGADINKCNGEGSTALTCAVANSRLDVIKYLLTLKNIDVNKAGKSGENPLKGLSPFWKNRIEIMKLLVEAGAAVDCNFFSEVIRRNEMDVLKYLIDKGANVNKPDEYGYTPLTHAINAENIEIITFLLENGARFSIHSNFIVAIERGNLEIIKLLMSHGVNINVISKTNRETPLIKAIKLELVNIVQEFLEHNVDVNLKNLQGNFPLIAAIELKNIEIGKLLIQNGADLNLTSPIGETPLKLAIKFGLTEIVQEILDHKVDVNLKSEQGTTLLITAIDLQQYEIAKLLIENGADPKSCDSKGRSALIKAVEHHQIELVQFLLEKGADINLPDNSNKTALMQALDVEDEALIKFLLDHGANAINNSSLLVQYVEQHNTKAIELLLQNGVDVNDVGEGGFTPLTKSLQMDKSEMVRFLVSRGAEVNKIDDNENTPLYLAASNSNFQIFEFLLKSGADVRRDLEKLEKIAKDDENFEYYLRSILKLKEKEGKLELESEELDIKENVVQATTEKVKDDDLCISGSSNQE